MKTCILIIRCSNPCQPVAMPHAVNFEPLEFNANHEVVIWTNGYGTKEMVVTLDGAILIRIKF